MTGPDHDLGAGVERAGGNLPAGLSLEDLTDAVRSSGYPLQGRVADLLGDLVDAPASAAVHEEWSYVDTESGQRRAIDVRCEIFPDIRGEFERVRPFVDLLVECKSSGLPWLFFTRPGSGHTLALPRIAGLRSEEIEIRDCSGGIYRLPLMQACGLISQPFVLDAAPTAGSFARARRKGKKVELSGTEGWESLTTPLLKAVDHLCLIAEPPATLRAFDARLVIPVAVLDAPMYAVSEDAEGDPNLRPIDWVRVERHETLSAADFRGRPRLSCFDAVHIDALPMYIEEMLAFADRFVGAVRRYQRVLADGQGFVPSMAGGYQHSDLRALTELEPSLRMEMRAAGLGTFAASLARPPMKLWRRMLSWSSPGPR